MSDLTTLQPSPDTDNEAAEVPPAAKVSDPLDAKKKKEIEKVKFAEIAAAKRVRTSRLPEWKGNVERRMGSTGSATEGVAVDGDIQSEINPDWSLTKTKTANLYSQVPTVQGTHENKQFAPAIPPFTKALNYELGEKRSNVGVPMDEALADVVNAAGHGVVMVGYAARFETTMVPAMDTKMIPPAILQTLMAANKLPMVKAEKVVDYMFPVRRISPKDFLSPADFIGSDFNNADWNGFTGRMSWSEAKNELKLTEAQKEAALGPRDGNDETLHTTSERSVPEAEVVYYDEIYYWRYRVDPDEKSFKCIWKLVYVEGIAEPVIHEAWKGQKYVPETRQYIGNVRFPIQVLTVTYITDNPIPPSDTAAGRPQVDDMRRSRSQMFKNRERSVPIRWFDVNRVDPEVQVNLMRGEWQGMIPMNGNGNNSIGEIARASYPSEDMAFDQATKVDLMESWHIGQNQRGNAAGGRTTGTEASIVQQNFQTVNGQERAKVATFFLRIAELMAGWMVLYSDFPSLSDQERTTMQQAWDQKHILHDLVLKIRPDSTIVLDSDARIEKLSKFLNLTAKSGFVNVSPIIAEMAELSGLDPSEIMTQPPPPPVDKPNISFPVSKENLINPVFLACMVQQKVAPSKEDLATAIEILEAAQKGEVNLQPPAPPAGPAGPGGPPSPGGPGGPPPDPSAPPPPPQGGVTHEANPDMQIMSKVTKRSRDAEG